MDFLVHYLDAARKLYKREPIVLSRVLTCWYKFDKYYKLTEQSLVYAAAVLLHLSLRKQYLDKNWKDRPNWIASSVGTARTLWQKEYRPVETSNEEDDNFTSYQRSKKKMYKLLPDEDDFERFMAVGQSQILSSPLANPAID
ncbi:hypothetical protein LTR28_002482 [Elasticomyces elasticus]|nr:hypothetical protein LTR28_002482 [Elasticomyces elasticus]